MLGYADKEDLYEFFKRYDVRSKYTMEDLERERAVLDALLAKQPSHTAFGASLVEKHDQERRRSSALANVAAQAGVAPGEWVRRNFPNGRDSQGQRLAEALDALIIAEDSKANGSY
jgi:hypothetical protein